MTEALVIRAKSSSLQAPQDDHWQRTSRCRRSRHRQRPPYQRKIKRKRSIVGWNLCDLNYCNIDDYMCSDNCNRSFHQRPIVYRYGYLLIGSVVVVVVVLLVVLLLTMYSSSTSFAWYNDYSRTTTKATIQRSFSNEPLHQAMYNTHQETRTTTHSKPSKIQQLFTLTTSASQKLPRYSSPDLLLTNPRIITSSSSTTNFIIPSPDFEMEIARLRKEYSASYPSTIISNLLVGSTPMQLAQLLNQRNRDTTTNQYTFSSQQSNDNNNNNIDPHFLWNQKNDMNRNSSAGNTTKNTSKNTKTHTGSTLRILIVGGSAATGCGNYHNQSYAAILQQRLQSLVQLTLSSSSFSSTSYDHSTSTTLHVESIAMKDLTEFPFLWCFSRQLTSLDIIVYDFGEEFSQPHLGRFEAFVRWILLVTHNNNNNNNNYQNNSQYQQQQHSIPPMLIIRGLRTLEQWSMLTEYYGLNALAILNNDEIASPRSFGIPTGPDALHAHNLDMVQHDLVAWLLSLFVATALEYLVGSNITSTAPKSIERRYESTTLLLPSPLYFSISKANDTVTSWEHLLLNPATATNLQCYTTYTHTTLLYGGTSMLELQQVATPSQQPPNSTTSTTTDRSTTTKSSIMLFQDAIVTGLAVPTLELSIEALLLHKSEQTAHRGWVLDLDRVSKRNKLLLRENSKRGNFYGYQDWKMAYYGVPSSGPMQVFLPIQNQDKLPMIDLLLVCEDDAPSKTKQACSLQQHDVSFYIQGQPTSIVPIQSDIVATPFGKSLCVQVVVPTGLATRTESVPTNTMSSSNANISSSPQYGVYLNITVSNPHVTWKNGPCSIAHIIWTTS